MSVKYVMTTRGMESMFTLAMRRDVELLAPVDPKFRSGLAGPGAADEKFVAARFLIRCSRRWLAHGFALSARAASVLSAWMERDRQRRQLNRMSVRDLQDIGLTPGDVYREGNLCFWMRSFRDETHAVRAGSLGRQGTGASARRSSSKNRVSGIGLSL